MHSLQAALLLAAAVLLAAGAGANGEDPCASFPDGGFDVFKCVEEIPGGEGEPPQKEGHPKTLCAACKAAHESECLAHVGGANNHKQGAAIMAGRYCAGEALEGTAGSVVAPTTSELCESCVSPGKPLDLAQPIGEVELGHCIEALLHHCPALLHEPYSPPMA